MNTVPIRRAIGQWTTRLKNAWANVRDRVSAKIADYPWVQKILRALGYVTPIGWITLLLALGAWWLGRRFNWVEAYAVAVLLSVIFLIALIWSLGRVSYRVELSTASRQVVVGEPGVGKLLVTNNSHRATASSSLELPVGTAFAQFHIPALGAGEAHEQLFTIPTKRRGVINVGPASSIRGDGLGIIRKRQEWTRARELYIHPETTYVVNNAVGFIRDIEGATTQDLSSSDVSFHALRDYVPGDDRRNVHWKTTARTGRLMVRQFEETRRAHMLLIFDTDYFAWDSDEEFELGVSIAASLGGAVIRGNKELTVFTQNGPVATGTGSKLMDSFTVIERSDTQPDLRELARMAVSYENSASVITLITGSQPTAESLHRAQMYFPVGAASMVLQTSPGAELKRHELSGMPVVTIPDLESLALGLYKAAP